MGILNKYDPNLTNFAYQTETITYNLVLDIDREADSVLNFDLTDLGWTQAVDFPDSLPSITVESFADNGIDTEGSPLLTHTQTSYPDI